MRMGTKWFAAGALFGVLTASVIGAGLYAQEDGRKEKEGEPRPERREGEQPRVKPKDGDRPREGERPVPQREGDRRPEGEQRPEGQRDGDLAPPRRKDGPPDGERNPNRPPPRGYDEFRRPDGRDGDSFFEGPDRLGPGRPRGPGMPPGEMDRIRRQDPEMFKLVERDQQLERECQMLSEEVRENRDNKEATKTSREKLATLVKEHFDVRQKQRQLRLARLEEELKKVKEAVESRQAQSEQIIKRRLNELTGDGEDIGF